MPGDQICASIAITNDSLQEQSESFYVHVFISDTAIAVTNDVAIVVIVDNDSKCIQCTAYNIIIIIILVLFVVYLSLSTP